MEFFLSVASIGMLCYLWGCLPLKTDYMKCFACGLATFFCQYVLVSGVLFVFDGFYIRRVLWILLVLNGILLLAVRRHSSFRVQPFHFRQYRLFLGIFVLLLPVGFAANGYFGMGQDQGVYQVKALFLMQDRTEKQLYYDEFEKLETEEEKETFLEDVFKNAGYDKYELKWWFNSEADRMNESSGYFHGVQTYPALLAWSGTLFGVEHMMLCQMFFLFLLLAFLSFLCDEITDREWVKLPVLVVIGFSPIVLWVAKASLTEMFLGVLFVLFFYFLKKGKGKTAWLSLLPLVTYSFYHVTIYTMLPMFACIYLFYFLKTGERRYVYMGMANVAGYVLGFLAMLRVNPTYTTNNYFNGLGFLSFLNEKTMPLFVLLVSGAALLFHVPFLFIRKPKKDWVNRLLSGRLFQVLLLLFAAACGLVIWKRMECDLQHLTLVGYTMMTGVIVLPVIAVLFLWQFFREKDFLEDTFKTAVFFGFLYTILLYSAVFRVEVRHYYYYGRYLLPYLPLIALVLAYLGRKLKWPWLLGITLLAGGFFVKYDTLLYTEPDDTRLSWKTLTGVLEAVDTQGTTAVFIDENLGTLYRLAIKGWTGADTYIVHDAETFSRQISQVEDEYDEIYYLTESEEAVDSEHVFSEVVRLANTSCEDLGLVGNTTKLPVEFVKETTYQCVYKMEMPKYTYRADDAASFTSYGFGNFEEGFAWMEAEDTGITCVLQKSGYTMTLQQKRFIPLEQLERSFYLEVFFNGNLAGSFEISQDSYEETLSMEIPEEWVTEGENQVTFRMDSMWSPEEIGSEDARSLGFCFQELSFKKD